MAKGHEFGARVRERRLALGLSMREAAARLGVSPSRLGAIERGAVYSTGNPTRPRRELVERIAEVYELPREVLLASAGYAVGELASLDEDARHLLAVFGTLSAEKKRIALGVLRVLSSQD